MSDIHQPPEQAPSERDMTVRPQGAVRAIYRLLSSSTLTMGLLIAILAACLAGVTVFRGNGAWELVFSTLWFNGLLVLLVLNVGFCFFGRMWGRKVTVISLGMILFHLSFVAIFCGVVYNSFYYFRGLIRLTEGETLPSGQQQSYDEALWGRFFDWSSVGGDVTLVKLHTGYTVEGENKRVAYEVEVGREGRKKQEILYITKGLEHEGFAYYRDREGYSLLVIVYDREGQEVYGAYIPLQSLKQGEYQYLYTTGTKDGPASFPFPQPPENPLFELLVSFQPAALTERSGEVNFQVWPLGNHESGQDRKTLASGKAAVGDWFQAGEYYLSVKEVRYWAAMKVHFEPGQPIVLASLWVGLGGVVLTFFGRLWRKKAATAVATGTTAETETEAGKVQE